MSAQHVPALAPHAENPGYPLGNLALKRPVRLALVGPDGVGKSTAIGLLQRWFAEQVPELSFEVRQWRPSLLPDLGVFIGKPSKPASKTPPRRKPGRFHLVRLFYYFLDFLIGSWWKDRVRSPAAALIVYDRCALDMYVDPVRFGLRSRFGTRLLWRMTPRPDVLVLLHDDPERIWQRKRELQRHEMAEQIATWFDLVRTGDVDGVIRVDSEPEEIAARLRNIVLDKLGWHKRPACAAVFPYPWLAAPGQPVSRHAVVPSVQDPRFLIPLSPNGVAAKSLAIYNAQSASARFSKRLLRAGLRSGLAQPFFTAKYSIDVPLQQHLSRILGCRDLHCGVSIGTPNRSQKPVLQLMDERGHILGYAKIGWNQRTIDLVQNEAHVLERVQKRTFSTAILPQVLHAGPWKQFFVLVQSASGGRLRPAPSRIDERHVQFLRELRGIRAPLRGLSTAPPDIDQVEHMGFPYYANVIQTGRALSSQVLEAEAVCPGFGHGDFAPWNTRLQGDKLLVLDWEYGGDNRPPMWDLFQFVTQTAIELDALPAAKIHTKLLGFKRWCPALDIPEHWFEPLLVAYLCDALTQNILIHGAVPDHTDRRGRATLAALLTILCVPGAHQR